MNTLQRFRPFCAFLALFLTAQQTLAGPFALTKNFTTTVLLKNTGTRTLTDSAGDEFTESLPSSLSIVSATASSGTVRLQAVRCPACASSTWSGFATS